MKSWIADTGPLVALLDRSDAYHSWAVECFRAIRPPIIVCEAVIAESLHLLSDLRPSTAGLQRLQQEGIIQVDFNFDAQAKVVWSLMDKYQDVPMDFADACIVRMAELTPKATVWTLDSDFTIYRMNRRKQLPLLSPF